jgi:L-alanine-DL-glutamate epimerase-like enolase superfamily enzyme
MKITSIRMFQVDLPFSGGTYLLSGGREYRNFDATVLRIETDGGHEGWGESTPCDGRRAGGACPRQEPGRRRVLGHPGQGDRLGRL